MNKLNENYSSIDQMANRLLSSQMAASNANSLKPGLSFQEVLNNTQSVRAEGLKFSKHASQRLATRNINLSAEQMER